MATPYFKGVLHGGAGGSLKKAAVEKTSVSADDLCIVRVFHCDDITKNVEEADLANDVLQAFKCIRANRRTTTKSVCENISKKLLVSDPLAFRLFAVNTAENTMRLLDDEEFPVLELNSAPDGLLKFAFLYKPQLKQKVSKALKNMQELAFQPESGDLTHRRLLNDQFFSKLSDLVFNVEGQQLYSFQAILKVRLPTLYTNELVVRKSKERKIASGVSLSIDVHDGVISYATMVLLLDWAYSGKLDMKKISDDQLMKVYKAAPLAGSTQLADLVEIYLKTNLCNKNVHMFLKYSDELGIDLLKRFAIDFSVINWATVMADKEGINVLGIDLFQELTLAVSEGEPPTPYEPEEPPENTIQRDFRLIYNSMEHHDGLIVVGEDTVPFHRAIVAAGSDKLCLRIFALKDYSKKLSTVSFENMTVAAIKGVLEMLYFGDTSMKHEPAACTIEHFVEPYHLPLIRSRAEEIIATDFDATNVLTVLRCTYLSLNEGRVHLTHLLRNRCLSYIAENFSTVQVSQLRRMFPEMAWDLIEILHKRFAQHKLTGLDDLDDHSVQNATESTFTTTKKPRFDASQ